MDNHADEIVEWPRHDATRIRIVESRSQDREGLRFMPELLRFIQAGDLSPEVIITHRMPLSDAAKGYQMFEKKLDDCRKVVLTP